MAKQLVIRDGHESIAMPHWYRDLITLGTIIGNWNASKGRLVIALACPTSRFAATAIAFGILWAESKKLKGVDREIMLSRINTLNVGEYLSIRTTKQVIGRYLGLEDGGRIRISGSRYLISKIEELHQVRSYESPRDAESISPNSSNQIISKLIDPLNSLSTLAQTLITFVSDKDKIKEDLNIELGIKTNLADLAQYQSLHSVIKVKNDSRNFGWCAESLSVDEMLLYSNPNLASHLILANNRSCAELSEYQVFNSKLFLLDSRDSLSGAHQAIQRYSRYCQRLDIKEIGWSPSKAFRGLVMVDKNG